MSRSIWSKVFTNFVNSLRPRQAKGNLMGEDYMNNKYFEIPAGTTSPFQFTVKSRIIISLYRL
jgi:hypothetical protein